MFLPTDVEFPLFRLNHILETLQDEEHSVGQWVAIYPYMPYQVLNTGTGGKLFIIEINRESVTTELPPAPRSSNNGPMFSLNLVEAIKRQWRFSENVTTMYPQDPVDANAMAIAQQRYAKFMNLMRLQSGMIVPTLDIDLFWHTHQLCPSNYNAWCMHYIGRCINHDDTIERPSLSNGLQSTKEAWQRAYNEPYVAPSGPLEVRMSASKTPPPNLTPAQRALWVYDVKTQEQHETFEYRYKIIMDRIGNYQVQISQIDAQGLEMVNIMPPTIVSLISMHFNPAVRQLESKKKDLESMIKK
jgi:hypothetical protein